MVDAVAKLAQLKGSVGRVIRGKPEAIEWIVAALPAFQGVQVKGPGGVGKQVINFGARYVKRAGDEIENGFVDGVGRVVEHGYRRGITH